jgi:hypothetical protein
MSGLIVKEYQIYCRNMKTCRQWSILTSNTPRLEAQRVALERGWKQDEEDLWVCPKCLRKNKEK